ncbi:hypothetical protein BOTBODRAFT_47224 [Botryobasidium botryosum FD-172 SS1]|uniref:Uncharacterized protein n=1 Tax=Botryobasidium botryosum (strain FD-172 SS1) TaxID=930990 RepID=A0A067MDU9_BOTB1|nr:hypothetical protein BOTBODRAFT_47224 [Botryobasidium botryosum FD-172 SS1]
MALFSYAFVLTSGLALVSVAVGTVAYYTQSNMKSCRDLTASYPESINLDGARAGDIESQSSRVYKKCRIPGPYPACPACHQFAEPHHHFVELCVNASVWVALPFILFLGVVATIVGTSSIFDSLVQPSATHTNPTAHTNSTTHANSTAHNLHRTHKLHQ